MEISFHAPRTRSKVESNFAAVGIERLFLLATLVEQGEALGSGK